MKDYKRTYGIVSFITFMFIMLFSSNLVLADPFQSQIHKSLSISSVPFDSSAYVDHNTGAATFSYPIEVIPGTNGLEPSISLSYNSYSRNSYPELSGSGWSLTQSYIQRDIKYTPTNLADDTFTLYLKGASMKLVKSSGNQYKTEIESFLYIERIFDVNNMNGDYWIVRSKDGTTYRFGYTTDSDLTYNRVTGNSWRWYIDTITDTHSNNIYYSYVDTINNADYGVKYLKTIEYNNDRSRAVEFSYSPLSRNWFVYQEGQSVRRAAKLTSVVIKDKTSNIQIRSYVISYVPNSQISTREYISEIKEYGLIGSEPLPPTSFEYENAKPGWERDQTIEKKLPIFSFSEDGFDGATRAIDLNLDGTLDILSNGLVFNSLRKAAYLQTSTGDFTFDTKYVLPEEAFFIDSYSEDYVRYPFDAGVRLGDYDGDGYVDAIKALSVEGKSEYGIWRNNGLGWQKLTSVQFPDLFSVMTLSSTSVINSYSKGIELVDLNADGKIDAIRGSDDFSKKAWIGTGSGWTEDSRWNLPAGMNTLVSGGDEDDGLRFVDINGDGLTDIYQADQDSNIYVYYNTGEGWMKYDTHYLSGIRFADLGGDDQGYRFSDVNDDGLMDILYAENKYRHTWLNSGSGWVESSEWFVPEVAEFVIGDGENEGTWLIDINGDSSVDIVRIDSTRGSISSLVWKNKYLKNGLMQKITLPYGGMIFFGYENSKATTNNKLGFNSWLVSDISTSIGPSIHSDSNSYVDCVPEACPVGSVDKGVDCSGGSCTRVCYQISCGQYSRVMDGRLSWSKYDFGSNDHSKTIFEYGPFLDNYCYKIVSGSDYAIIDSSSIRDDDSGDYDAAIALSWELGSQLQPFGGNCKADSEGDLLNKYSYYLIDDRDSGDNFDSADSLAGEWTGYCMPKSYGCSSVYGYPCATSCSGEIIDYRITAVPDIIEPYVALDPDNPHGACHADSWGPPSMGSIDFENNKYVWMYVDRAPLIESVTATKTCSRLPSVETSYSYEGGLYDFSDKELRGFSKVTQINPDGSVANSKYHQDDYKKGMIEYSDLLHADNTPLSKIEYTYSVSNSGGVSKVMLESSKDHVYGSSVDMVLETRYEYDSYGNPVRVFMKGDPSSSSDDRNLYTTYVYNPLKWIVSLPATLKITGADGNVVNQINNYYDNNPLFGTPKIGDLTKVEHVGEGNPTNEYTYDTFGNVISYKSPGGHVTKYSYDATGTYINSTTNPLGHKSQYEIEFGTGNMLSSIDPNGFNTVYQYDDMHRIKSERYEYDPPSSPSVLYNYYLGLETQGIKYNVIESRYKKEDNHFISSVSYLDPFLREIQVGDSNSVEEYITNYRKYDVNGRIKWESNPVLVNYLGIGKISDTYSGISYSYDPLGRVTNVVNSDGSSINYNYDGLKVDVTDENGDLTSKYYDAFGNIIKVEENNLGETYTTLYSYDLMGNLISIKDNQDNLFSYSYDSLGRKVKIDDPDLGVLTYKYDLEGNLIDQSFSGGPSMHFEYDPLGRLILKSSGGSEYRYSYDESLKGTLSKISSKDYVKSFDYDKRYRVINSKTLIDGQMLEDDFSYDHLGNMLEVSYSNGNNVSYSYNGLSSVTSISDIISDVTYKPWQSPEKITYENSFYTDFTYDPSMLRVTRIRTPAIQDIGYRYDPSGNIMEVSDSVQGSVLYEYDDLDRLVAAYNSTYEDMEYLYTYDSIGNILNITTDNESIAFFYSDKPVHSPISMIIKKIGELKNFTLNLEEGLNLVSIPFHVYNISELPDDSVSNIINPIAPNLLSVFEYDESQWYSYNPVKPDQLNTLQLSNITKGYWYSMYAKDTLYLEGDVKYPVIFHLSTGLNLIGYPSLDEANVADALAGLNGKYENIIGFDAKTDEWSSYSPEKPEFLNTLSVMKPGSGYWISVKSPMVISFDGKTYKVISQ